MVTRKFVTLDGEILEESMWEPSPIHTCFYCGTPSTLWKTNSECVHSQLGEHELVTLIGK